MKIILDARRMDTKEAAHVYLQEQLGFPEYYGKNLDALYECMCELMDVKLIILHRCEAQNYYLRVEPVLRKAGEENSELEIQFTGYKKRRRHKRNNR